MPLEQMANEFLSEAQERRAQFEAAQAAARKQADADRDPEAYARKLAQQATGEATVESMRLAGIEGGVALACFLVSQAFQLVREKSPKESDPEGSYLDPAVLDAARPYLEAAEQAARIAGLLAPTRMDIKQSISGGPPDLGRMMPKGPTSTKL